MLKFSVTKHGKELNKKLYSWDEETRTLSTNEHELVLNFGNISNCTFKTGSYCTFKTGSYCTFDTGSDCTFTTGSNCTFNTGHSCTFNTGHSCTFDTGSDCTFNTESNCTFKTESYCTFKTKSYCTFTTGHNCTFNTGQECVVVRRDVFEIIKLTEAIKIKLNSFGNPGYEEIKDSYIIILDGKEIVLSEESYNNLKNQLK